jgi:excisionase family DNA binding protein
VSATSVPETGRRRRREPAGAAPVAETVPDRFLTAVEVGERLGLPESWIREETRQGRFPHVKFGRYRRYVWDDVIAYVERLKSGA